MTTGSRGAAAAHGDDDDVARAREQAGDVARDGGLPHALARADDGQRRLRVGRERDRVEPEVRADVGQPVRERARGEPEPAPRPGDRLVGEVDHDVHVHFDQGVGQLVPERDAVVGHAAADLLGAAEHDRADDLVVERGERLDDDVRVVLPVDERERSHGRLVSSFSIRAVYFSYSSVSIENWMIRSCPW